MSENHPEAPGALARQGWRRRFRVLLVCLTLAAVALAAFTLLVRRESRWVAEAQAAVETYLRDHPDAPVQPDATLSGSYGAFREMTGAGYQYPAWNIQGYHYLIAHRVGHFSKGPLPMRLYVTEGAKTQPGRAEIIVEPGLTWDGGHLDVRVSHPELRGWVLSLVGF